MEYSMQTDTGLKRKNNQDYMTVFSLAEQMEIFLLADGMGGMDKGEVASKMAVDVFVEHLKEWKNQMLISVQEGRFQELKEVLREGFRVSNQAVAEYAAGELETRGMGTTLICAFVQQDRLILGNIGDSRAYLLHQGDLIQITKDHSYVQELVDRGALTPKEARYNKRKNYITRAIGTEIEVKADMFELELEAGDKLLLCSDGLTNMVHDSLIKRVLEENTQSHMAMDILLNKALENGGSDNITLFCIFI